MSNGLTGTNKRQRQIQKKKETKKITQTKTKTIARKNRHKDKNIYRIDKDKDKDEDEALGCREWSDRDNLGGIPHSQEIQMVLTIITPAAHPGKCTVHTAQCHLVRKYFIQLHKYTPSTHPHCTISQLLHFFTANSSQSERH